MALNLSDLTKQSTRPYDWIWNKTVATPLGEFEVSLGPEGKGAPDDEMLRRGAELVQYAEANGEYIVDIVYGHYLFACKNGWMDYSHFPKGMSTEGLVHEGLTRGEMASQLRDGGCLSVTQDLDLELDDLPPYESKIIVVPLWDEEHGLEMLFEDGKVVRVNEGRFKLVDGALEFLGEDEEVDED